MLEVAIINLNISNLHSVQAACNRVGLESKITSNIDYISKAKSIILPGVGSFPEAMHRLKKLKLDEIIKEFIKKKKPFFGICLGMQLLFSESEEFGNCKGLNIFEGSVKKFDFQIINNTKFSVPQIGWNRIYKSTVEWHNTLLNGVTNQEFMYFVHSYFVKPTNEGIAVAKTDYGHIRYCSAISFKNVFASQFHPEKSGAKGLKIYENFKKEINKIKQ